jgi:hypothetical protein
MRLTDHKALTGDWKVAYSILVEKPEGKRSLGRSRLRWEDNIIRDLQKVGRRGSDRITFVASDFGFYKMRGIY